MLVVQEKTFRQVWRELSKQGWKYKKPTGLSNDNRYLPPEGNVSLLRHCRNQGWLDLPPLLPPPAPATTAQAPPDVIAQPVTGVLDDPPIPPAAAAVAIAETASASSATMTSTASTGKTTATAKKKPAHLVTLDTAEAIEDDPEQATTDITESRLDNSEQPITDVPVNAVGTVAIEEHSERATTDNTEQTQDVPEHTAADIPVRVVESAGRVSRSVALDDFDYETILDALKRDRLFGPPSADDLNMGESDWQLSLDSEPESDEEGILLDEDNGEQDTGLETGGSNGDDFELPLPDVLEDADHGTPVEFDLTSDDLERLRLQEWDTFHEHRSGQVLLDPAPLYDGPSGPTRAASAYAENPLSIFYFFLPKELWRKIAAETINIVVRVSMLLRKLRGHLLCSGDK
ncbi:hypothetical protein V7S43_017957 [Phytophthora oleae]|uniref:Uncharacterized protein n=1 Tax=Phytophthora oleae TaxID=2107226 RepID=A0ABD3ERS2_9STRA